MLNGGCHINCPTKSKNRGIVMRLLLLLLLCGASLVAAEQSRLTFSTIARKVVFLELLTCDGEWNKCVAQLPALEPDDLVYMERCCIDHEEAADAVNDLRLPAIKMYFDTLCYTQRAPRMSPHPNDRQFDQWVQEEDETTEELFKNVPIVAHKDQLTTDAAGNVTGHLYGIPLQQSLAQGRQTASEKSEISADYERAFEIFSLKGTARWPHVEALQTAIATTLFGDKDAIQTYLALEKTSAHYMALQIAQLKKDWMVKWNDARLYMHAKAHTDDFRDGILE